MTLNMKTINELMRINDMSMCQFSKFIGHPKSSVSRVFRGLREPSLRFVMKISFAFEIPMENLIIYKNKEKGGNRL